jgi:ribosome-associated protein
VRGQQARSITDFSHIRIDILVNLKQLQQAAVEALEDIKARDIQVYDVTGTSALFDRVIIATAESGRQLGALASNLRDGVKAAGGSIRHVEGEKTGEWVLVDLGDIVVHIMLPAIRQQYNLEELWGQKRVKIQTFVEKPAQASVQTGAQVTSPAKKVVAKKAATKKVAAKKAPVKKTPAKKTVAKTAAKKTAVKKTAVKKTAVKKATVKKAPVKKVVAKKVVVKKAVVKTSAVKKPAVKKVAGKTSATSRPIAKKATVKKVVAKKVVAKKAPVKKTTASNKAVKKPAAKKAVTKTVAVKKTAAKKTARR